MLYLSLDVGTSATKAAVLDDELNELSSSRAGYAYVLLPGSKVEMAPGDVLAGIGTAISRLDPALLPHVGCLTYDAFSPSPVYLRVDGSLAYPNIITHMDRRSAAESRLVDAVVGNEAFLGITGMLPFVGGSALLSVLWMRANRPDCLAETSRITHLQGYLHALLTGRVVTDRVNASMTGLYETVAQSGWSARLIDAFHLDSSWFGEIGDPGTVCGELLPEVADRWNLPRGIPVTLGTNDMAAAQVGAGNTGPGRIMNAAGSSEMVSILTDVPVPSTAYYLRNAATPGIWQIYATTAGGFALEWFREQFARELSAEQFYGDLLPAALEGPDDGAVGFAPYLTGDRQSLDVKRACWTGLTIGTTREQMLRALATSMVRVLADTVARASESVRLDRQVKISGGLALEALIRLKRREMPGYDFVTVDDCPIKGNVRLAQVVGEVR